MVEVRVYRSKPDAGRDPRGHAACIEGEVRTSPGVVRPRLS